MSNVATNIPLINTPFVGQNGLISEPWFMFLVQLFNRTGGATGINDTDAVGLTRNRIGSNNESFEEKFVPVRSRQQKSADVIPTRKSQTKQVEIVPQREQRQKLFLTKETYKPLTLIRLYTGLTADIPTGWHLADGTAGTPNLSDKFIVGSGNLYATGSTGGSTTIAANNLPVHTHPYNDLNTTYTTTTVAVQSGTGTTVVNAINGTSVDTGRTTGNNTTTAAAYLPPYYATAYIINTQTVTIVTDVKLR